MSDFEQISLLTIDNQSLSLGTVLQYFQLSGKLMPWIRDILEQHIVFQTIQSRNDLNILESEVDQAVINFRINNQLSDADVFEQWLINQGIDFAVLRSRFVIGLKVDKLKALIAEPNLQALFDQQKLALDQVELYYMIAASQEIAEEIQHKIEQESNFEKVAREYALAEEPQVSLVRRTFSLAQLPEDLRAAIAQKQAGDTVGAIEVEQRWCVFRIEAVVPAVLEGELKLALQNQLFEQWVADQIQQLSVRLGGSQLAEASAVETEERELVATM
ncbi:MAG: peptidyl-prolyl cis-trans isomerase [Leptolyngbya sp. UWPOB_LEPTO1]|uniref:peptidylprolyl isomerase n=1 Tax=Leptolyngbya sp. UWPOB_LEPTO1 TaxID=2815653 RepID=UPI001AC0CA9E|nr:peptidylprolyl isomerase [Leptolyngbya sp. UWPOB_LEPTO1]MBN8561656.1 peptidyl-prolyl cis-trans isomerase [Leptolyngbya sp. UWPOB_LEPTO1]